MQDTVTGWDLLFAGIAAVLVPFLVGLGLANLRELGWDIPSWIRETGFIMLFSPLFSWIGAFVAVPFAVGALRMGRAGWLFAVLSGAFFPSFVVGLLFSLMDAKAGVAMFWMTLPIGALAGAVYWLTVRLRRPTAFVRPCSG